ncbi:hypothetical protein HZH68_014031 [Vespula germanica]|uniref:Uncharacterized protein n=1 Tax=Vespula germanica TaxID=30212 RepID=A0A834JDD5_VESGE|nr:hypothetical protein HZH68_014031 [Vespula germanica]
MTVTAKSLVIKTSRLGNLQYRKEGGRRGREEGEGKGDGDGGGGGGGEFSAITSVGLEKGFHANSCQIGNDEDGGSERRGTGRTIELGLRDSETT